MRSIFVMVLAALTAAGEPPPMGRYRRCTGSEAPGTPVLRVARDPRAPDLFLAYYIKDTSCLYRVGQSAKTCGITSKTRSYCPSPSNEVLWLKVPLTPNRLVLMRVDRSITYIEGLPGG